MNSVKRFETYSDLEIIQQVLGGEIALFEILMRRYNATLYKTGRAYNFGHEDTQDLMQESWVNIYKSLKSFENRSTFKTWALKIMLNNCFHKSKKLSYKNEIPTDINEKQMPMRYLQSHTNDDRSFNNKELNHVIETALQNIPFDYRIVFSLREMNGLNVGETAETLNISEANVKVRLNRAKAMLRKELEKSYTTEDIFEFNLKYCDAMVERVMKEISSVDDLMPWNKNKAVLKRLIFP